jgi:CheY-like chemotaxis protein
MARPVVAVVNDDTQFLRLMEMVLSSAGYDTLIFFEGKTAFDDIRSNMPDLVVLDIRMESPESGWIILDLMRLDESTANIPVVVCSADHDQLLSKEDYLASKRAGVLRKPFDIDDLIAKVGQYLTPASDSAASTCVSSPAGEGA